MSVMTPHRFHRSVGTQSNKGERLSIMCWMECIAWYRKDRLLLLRWWWTVAHDRSTAPPILLPAPCLCTPYRTFFLCDRQCISSVTQFLCCSGDTQTTYVVLPIFQKAFSLKAVSPFIAHKAATITIPLSSFFRDVEWQGREVRSFRAQQGQWWVEDATFHSKLAARCPSIIACSSSIPFPALFNSLPALAHFMFWETNLLRWSSIFFAKFAIGTFRSSSSALFFRFLLAVS